MIRRTFIHFLAACAVIAFGAAPAMADKAKQRGVSDGDPKNWNQALNVIKNVQTDYGKDNVDVELVVFGHGSGMLKFDSPLGNRVEEALGNGAQVLMCENTMKGQKLTRADMLPKIGYVKAGVIEIVEKSRQGWTVVRP